MFTSYLTLLATARHDFAHKLRRMLPCSLPASDSAISSVSSIFRSSHERDSTAGWNQSYNIPRTSLRVSSPVSKLLHSCYTALLHHRNGLFLGHRKWPKGHFLSWKRLCPPTGLPHVYLFLEGWSRGQATMLHPFPTRCHRRMLSLMSHEVAVSVQSPLRCPADTSSGRLRQTRSAVAGDSHSPRPA